MVGRLVEQQQVGAAEADQRQHQPRLLAAGERPDRLEHAIAAETEAAEKVAQLLLVLRAAASPPWRRRCCSGDSSISQLLELMLREVADAQVPRLGALAVARGSSSPASSFISVDLPAPLRPSSPMRSPGAMVMFNDSQHDALAVTHRLLLQREQRTRQFLRRAGTRTRTANRRAPARSAPCVPAPSGGSAPAAPCSPSRGSARRSSSCARSRAAAARTSTAAARAAPRAALRTPSSCRCRASRVLVLDVHDAVHAASRNSRSCAIISSVPG